MPRPLTELRRRGQALWQVAFGGTRAWRLAVLAVLVWLATGFYTVGSNQRSVVLRFGRVAERAGPGLHLAWPWPIVWKRVAGMFGKFFTT